MSDDKSMQERETNAKVIEEFCRKLANGQGVELEEVSWNPNVDKWVDKYTLSISGNNYSFSIPVSYEDLVDYQGGVGVAVIEAEIRNGIRNRQRPNQSLNLARYSRRASKFSRRSLKAREGNDRSEQRNVH